VQPLEKLNVAACYLVAEEIMMAPEDYKIILFLPTARQAEYLAYLLNAWFNGGFEGWMGNPLDGTDKVTIQPMHSRMSMPQRTRGSDMFRNAKRGIMVSSDVSARGVDYPNVTCVFQIGAPSSKDQYVHRLGRTGRAGKSGRGLLLLNDFERSFARKLGGLPVEDANHEVDEMSTKFGEAGLRSVSLAADSISMKSRAQTYAAWIGYYKGHKDAVFGGPSFMVQAANRLATEVLLCKSIPPIMAKTVGKMGLKGVPGLMIVKNEDYMWK